MKAVLIALLAAAAVSVGATGSTAGTFPTCLGEPATKIGTAGDDTITGTEDDEVIVGLAGNDTIVGGGGFDLICGGDGNDSILQTSGGLFGAAVVTGDAGDDTIQGGPDSLVAADYEQSPAAVTVDLTAGTAIGDGTDTLVGVDIAYGSAFGDVLTGNAKQNILAGFGGNDTISAGAGNDLLGGEAGDDVIDGGPGRDEIHYEDAAHGLKLRLGKGTATGDGNDRLKSLEIVYGSRHADLLVGGPTRSSAAPETTSSSGWAVATSSWAARARTELTAVRDGTSAAQRRSSTAHEKHRLARRPVLARARAGRRRGRVAAVDGVPVGDAPGQARRTALGSRVERPGRDGGDRPRRDDVRTRSAVGIPGDVCRDRGDAPRRRRLVRPHDLEHGKRLRLGPRVPFRRTAAGRPLLLARLRGGAGQRRQSAGFGSCPSTHSAARPTRGRLGTRSYRR